MDQEDQDAARFETLRMVAAMLVENGEAETALICAKTPEQEDDQVGWDKFALIRLVDLSQINSTSALITTHPDLRACTIEAGFRLVGDEDVDFPELRKEVVLEEWDVSKGDREACGDTGERSIFDLDTGDIVAFYEPR